MSAGPHPDQSPLSVWITRAEPGASATAARLAALHFTPLVAPLLRFQPIDADLTVEPGEALAFTSINAVARTAALSPERHARVFAVGDATAEAARAAGFSDVVSAGGDVEALTALIVNARPENGVVHPCARQTAGDLVGGLKTQGVKARKLAVYETVASTVAPPPVAEALNGGALAAVLLHSPKAARVAALVISDQGYDLSAVIGVGLSPACVAPLQGAGFKALLAAARPDEDALLDVLATRTPEPDGRG